ncbi:PIN domain-like protein [Mycena pura]|uniref:PIN domain-like protein n=1 Tax=Mycena pura TaxID=153505 RepID=A0AAD6V7C0_9AGAR|nr:PIN domain-like protein [Mycena pura]
MSTHPQSSQAIKPAAEQHDFLEFTLQAGFRHGGPECVPMMIGVDASIWMYQADRVISFSNAKAGPNPQLRVLFYRLAHLLSLPIRIVFVFDGPERPATKRGVHVLTQRHRLTAPFLELIREFGYHAYEAPGEAEAELAMLNKSGIIDAVMTTDVDVLLFGAQAIVIPPNKKKDGGNVTVYTSERVFITPTVSLSRGGLLLVALLAGGDYDKSKGIAGCGIHFALSVARHSNLGDLLLRETLNHPEVTAGFTAFLERWRNAVAHEFYDDPNGYLGRKHPAISAAILTPPSFPDLDVLYAYTHPITSWSPNHSLPDYQTWGLPQPSLTGIAKLCQLRFGWKATEISKTFTRCLYPGIVLQSLLQPFDLHALLHAHVNHGVSMDTEFPRSSVLSIVRTKTIQLAAHLSEHYLVKVSTAAVGFQVRSVLKDPLAFPTATLAHIWIPARIIHYALPDLRVISACTRVDGARRKNKPKKIGAVPFTFECLKPI